METFKDLTSFYTFNDYVSEYYIYKIKKKTFQLVFLFGLLRN